MYWDREKKNISPTGKMIFFSFLKYFIVTEKVMLDICTCSKHFCCVIYR